jgi:MinD superfamily P-loop ATPase
MDIAIASGKGGTGKTTIAVNLVSFIKNNIANCFDEVALVDLDVEEPNSGLFLSGELLKKEVQYRPIPGWNKDSCTLCGKCQSVCQYNAIAQLPNMLLIYPELCHSCFACSDLCPEQALPMADREIGVLKHYEIRSGNKESTCFSFVESALKIGEPSAVPLIQKTKNYARSILDGNHLKIIDCPPGTSCPMIESVKDVDFAILVTEPTPFGLYDLKLAVETLRELRIEFGVVVNRYGIGDDGVEKYCQSENIRIITKILHLREVAIHYSKGELMWEHLQEFKNNMAEITNFLHGLPQVKTNKL